MPRYDVCEARFEMPCLNIERLAKYKNTGQSINFDKQLPRCGKIVEPERVYGD